MTQNDPIHDLDAKYINNILENQESKNLEYKTAQNNYSHDKLAAYCVALANEGGGRILFGINDDRQIVGSQALKEPSDLEIKLLDRLNIDITINERFPNGQRVVEVVIPGRHKGVPVHDNGKYLMRAGSSLVSMSTDRLRDIFNEGQNPFIKRIVKDNLAEDELLRHFDITTYYKQMNHQPTQDSSDIINRLLHKNLAVKNQNKTYGITALGGLTLGVDLTELGELRHKRIRVIQFEDETIQNAISDQFFNKGYIAAMLEIVDIVLPSILPTHEDISTASRITAPSYPRLALRELLANALFHQELDILGTHPTIHIHPGFISISNPGVPLIEVERFINENQSRNPELAELMYDLNLFEGRGSGMDRVLNEVELAQIAAPKYQIGEKVTEVVLNANLKFKDMTSEERVWATFMHCCLLHVSQEQMTNASLRKRFGLQSDKATQVSAVISAAISDNLIKPANENSTSRKYQKYVPFFA